MNESHGDDIVDRLHSRHEPIKTMGILALRVMKRRGEIERRTSRGEPLRQSLGDLIWSEVDRETMRAMR